MLGIGQVPGELRRLVAQMHDSIFAAPQRPELQVAELVLRADLKVVMTVLV